MSQVKHHQVTINILDKEYVIGCPEGSEAELSAAAAQLDKKMREVRDGGKVLGMERIAVMTALNLSHELLLHNSQQQHAIEKKLQLLGERIDQSLSKKRPSEEI